MSRFSRLTIVLAAIVAILAVIGISAVTNIAEAGGGPTNIRFEVTPSIQSTSGTWPATNVFYRSVETVLLERGTWFRPGVTASSGPVTLGSTPTSVTLSGDPSFWYYATGTWLNYPDGTRNAFASAQWYSTTENCDAPRMIASITNPRTEWVVGKGTIDNRNGRNKLFVSENDGPWVDLPIGDFWTSSSKKVAQIRVSVDGSGTLEKMCADLRWNLTKEWIEGATPTPTPSPTATPAPAPKPVVFKLANSAVSTIEVGSSIDLFIMLDSQGQETTKAQAFLHYDPRVISVKPLKGNCPFDKSYEISVGYVDTETNQAVFVGEPTSSITLNCVGLAMQITGLMKGSTTLTFHSASVAYDENNNLMPSDLRNGQITVKAKRNHR